MRKRRARRKAVGARAPILVEARPNARWSTDFVHDQFANGRRLRILNRDCQDFRVRAATMDPMEVLDGTTQSPPHS
jgi:hypothetical protein